VKNHYTLFKLSDDKNKKVAAFVFRIMSRFPGFKQFVKKAQKLQSEKGEYKQ